MIFLEDLLQANDFNQAVDNLAGEFRKKHDLPGIHQLGLVVPDVVEAALKLEENGLGPFFIAGGSPTFWQERGEEKSFSGKLGIAYHEGFELELLEPGQGSDFYRQSLDENGKIIVQHLGLKVKNVDDWADKLVQEGYPVYVRGKLRTGPMGSDFAYMDTAAEAGLVIEFISWNLLGIKCNPPGGIFRMIGKIQHRTGKRDLSI